MSKFVKLNQITPDKQVYVNIDSIDVITEQGYGARLYLSPLGSETPYMAVKEKPEQIMEMIGMSMAQPVVNVPPLRFNRIGV